MTHNQYRSLRCIPLAFAAGFALAFFWVFL
jgi:hypothetical protein